jgi:TolB-like protein/tetratricopeptide (TPR) repeat protein
MTAKLQITLHGACIVRGRSSAGPFEIRPAKHRALFALLATAPEGRRTRAWLLTMLWGETGRDGGLQSLRTALSRLRREMGDAFDRCLRVDHAEVALDLSAVELLGSPQDGAFLEGLDLRDDEFNHWLRERRATAQGVAPPPRQIRPAIAVLPFRVVQGGPMEAVLGDWLAEECCRALSRSSLLTVISHLSARGMAAQTPDLTQLRLGLGVDYAITGSLRQSEGHVVLDADCVETASGRLLWTRQVRGSLAAFLSVESPPVAEIVQAVGRGIAAEALAHARGRSLAALEDHHPLIAGVGLMHELRLSSFSRSRALIEEAIRRAPRVPEAHAWLGEWHVMSVFNGWSDDPLRDAGRAMAATEAALALEPDNAFALTIDGGVMSTLFQRADAAQSRFDRALEANPNESMAWLLSGVLAAFRDEGAEAVRRTRHAMRLSPVDPFGYFYDSMAATAHLAAEDWSRALTHAESSWARNDRHISTLRVKICALHHLGRGAEAREAGQELLRRQPSFSLAQYRRTHPAAEARVGRHVIAALQEAGLV